MKKGIEHYQVGERFADFMLIKEVSKGVASNGKPFLTIIFRDTTGEIEAKLWGATPEDEALYVIEKIVKLNGEITEFRGRRQLKIIAIRLANPMDAVQITDFIQMAPIKKEILMEKITEAIFEMKNPTIQRIVRTFVSKYQENLLTYPAASRNHHEYASGLAHI